MRANETAVRGLVLTNSSMTCPTSSSISTIGCGMPVGGITESTRQVFQSPLLLGSAKTRPHAIHFWIVCLCTDIPIRGCVEEGSGVVERCEPIRVYFGQVIRILTPPCSPSQRARIHVHTCGLLRDLPLRVQYNPVSILTTVSLKVLRIGSLIDLDGPNMLKRGSRHFLG